MPEEAKTSTDVQSALENLEDYDLEFPVIRARDYQTIQIALEKNEVQNKEDLKRLLAVCIHDMSSMKYTTTVITIIPAILSKVKVVKFITTFYIIYYKVNHNVCIQFSRQAVTFLQQTWHHLQQR